MNVGGAEIKGTARGLQGNCGAFDEIDLVNELLIFVADLLDKV